MLDSCHQHAVFELFCMLGRHKTLRTAVLSELFLQSSTFDSTRTFMTNGNTCGAEIQSDTPCPNRDDSNKGKQKENSMTRKNLKATGAEFMYPYLTGSSLRSC